MYDQIETETEFMWWIGDKTVEDEIWEYGEFGESEFRNGEYEWFDGEKFDVWECGEADADC